MQERLLDSLGREEERIINSVAEDGGFNPMFILFLNLFLKVYLIERERERAREQEHEQERGRKRGRENPKQDLQWQHRALYGGQTHKP